jgi:hypothetical protein
MEMTAVKQIAGPQSRREKNLSQPDKIFPAKKEKEDERGDEEIKVSFFEDPEEMTVLEKRILETLKGKGKMKRSDIQETLPDHSTRSLQRKLNGLINKNLLEVEREGRDTFYFQKG